MSVAAPVRRLAPRCPYFRLTRVPSHVEHQQRRLATCDYTGQSRGYSTQGGGDGPSNKPNPVLDEYKRKLPLGKPEPEAMPEAGDIGATSIFEDDRRAQQQMEKQAARDGVDSQPKTAAVTRDPQHMARIIDPDPNARERWERKKVIQMIRKGGRLTRAQFTQRTEREHMARSENMKTSIKKLGMLARQIAGKTIDDAIVQMRFSRKKVAKEVMKHLEAARDEAIVMRGMGLGKIEESPGTLNDSSPTITALTSPSGAKSASTSPLEIQLKDGKRHKVTDRSKIYVDQAWVGRGPFGTLVDHRARGRIYILKTPWTSLSVVLKEEATRVREYAEREEKRRKAMLARVWVPLPDRPVVQQRQWYSW